MITLYFYMLIGMSEIMYSSANALAGYLGDVYAIIGQDRKIWSGFEE